MEKLLKAREIINETDKEIASLFEKRMYAVRLIAEYKQERGLPVFDAGREAEVVKTNLQYIKNEEIKDYYVSFIEETMSISKRFQRHIIAKSCAEKTSE